MTISKKVDLCVIGAGPGGYVAAIRAAQLGLKTIIIEDNHLGGICLNWGCIPTKALLRSSEINHLLHNLDQFGFSAKDIKFDFNKIIERSRKVSKQLSSGIAGLLKKNKIEVIDGFGKISAQKNVEVSKNNEVIANINAKNIIIATGARARQIKGLESDSEFIWSYREAMTPKSLPKSILVVGSGAIGVEFASFYNNMGVDVTIVEMAKNILPVEDEEISKLARKSFEKQGIKIHSSANLKKINKNKDSVTAIVEIDGKEQKIEAQKAIMAVGIVPNVENIGLNNTIINLDRGFIVTNGYLETDEENIYAIGDVTSAPWLAHKASHEGVIAAEKIAEKLGKFDASNTHPMKTENIPGCTYCMPQIASVGLTEAKAKELGKKIKVGRFPYMANGKAIAMGETEGLIKTIFDEESGELLGAHLIGAEVTEMIQGYVIGKQAELTESDFMHTIFPHPTMSEMMHESVLDAFDKAIHF
ncbi:dihydrolipoyl dehydrogenase [Rickettsiales bacterium]|nr:dihydrolipoyl dehydrogenase [Rickettsiales bacterium]